MDFKNINPKIIIQTSLFGVFMGIFSVLGWIQNSQPFIWLFTGLLTSIYLYDNLTQYIFLHCIIIGVSWGIDCSIVEIIFFKAFQLNNPYFVNELYNISSSSPRIILFIISVFSGLLLGILIYIPIYILKRFKK